MTFKGRRWTLEGRPKDFHQRFEATVNRDRIDAKWERSDDGESWSEDFRVTYTRQIS